MKGAVMKVIVCEIKAQELYTVKIVAIKRDYNSVCAIHVAIIIATVKSSARAHKRELYNFQEYIKE